MLPCTECLCPAPPPISYVENLNPKIMIVGGWPLG